jgi:hypothetical protein
VLTLVPAAGRPSKYGSDPNFVIVNSVVPKSLQVGGGGAARACLAGWMGMPAYVDQPLSRLPVDYQLDQKAEP